MCIKLWIHPRNSRWAGMRVAVGHPRLTAARWAVTGAIDRPATQDPGHQGPVPRADPAARLPRRRRVSSRLEAAACRGRRNGLAPKPVPFRSSFRFSASPLAVVPNGDGDGRLGPSGDDAGGGRFLADGDPRRLQAGRGWLSARVRGPLGAAERTRLARRDHRQTRSTLARLWHPRHLRHRPIGEEELRFVLIHKWAELGISMWPIDRIGRVRRACENRRRPRVD